MGPLWIRYTSIDVIITLAKKEGHIVKRAGLMINSFLASLNSDLVYIILDYFFI